MKKLENALVDYWDKSRALESRTIDDLEKHLWLVNSAAATITIGFIQSKNGVHCLQLIGGWAFVLGIISLLCMKFMAAINSSRDRKRFQEVSPEITEDNFEEKMREIKDTTFHRLRWMYLILQYGSGILFIGGCILILLGIN
ncbi:hypothetical protein [Legionella pneumophila]|uniref:hypothetical protein n=1 Tax=Legionella pneumophila TaxID=446 RepID=UPI000D049602|nr:hypothetical protein [Legionella pneumophila]